MQNKNTNNKLKLVLIMIFITMLFGCSSTEIKNDETASEHYMKAESAYAKKNYRLAEKHYQAVIKAYPNNIEALFKLANVSMRVKQFDNAMKYYTAIIHLKPNHAKAHHNLAMLHLHNAKNHLNYYIANNKSFNNKSLSDLIYSIDSYAKKRVKKQSPLDKLADAVK